MFAKRLSKSIQTKLNNTQEIIMSFSNLVTSTSNDSKPQGYYACLIITFQCNKKNAISLSIRLNNADAFQFKRSEQACIGGWKLRSGHYKTSNTLKQLENNYEALMQRVINTRKNPLIGIKNIKVSATKSVVNNLFEG